MIRFNVPILRYNSTLANPSPNLQSYHYGTNTSTNIPFDPNGDVTLILQKNAQACEPSSSQDGPNEVSLSTSDKTEKQSG